MKKNSIFEPARQSAIYGIFEVFRLIKVFATVFIIPIVSLLRDSSNASKVFYVQIGLIFLLIIIIVTAIAKYLRNTYYLSEDNEFIVEEGVLSRSKISIPFDRIQSVDFEQNLIHQIFGVVKLKIDTAGAKDEEVSLKAIDINKASLIKSAILSYTGQMSSTVKSEVNVRQMNSHTVFELDIPRLIKVGLTKNVFSSLALIVALGYQLIDNLNQIGFTEDVKTYIDGASNEIAKTDAIFIGVIIAFLIFMSFIVNLMRAVIKHYGLRLEIQNDSFVLNQGLFNRKLSTVKVSKIQTLSWNYNLFEGLLSMNELMIRHASASEGTLKNSMLIPGVSKGHIQTVLDFLFGDKFSIPHEFTNVSRKLFYRLVLFSMFPLMIYFVLVYLQIVYFTYIPVFIYVLVVYSLHLYQKKQSYAIDDDYVYIKGGIFGFKQVILPIHTINNIVIKSSPYQRNNNLSSLTLHHGAGHESISYIDESSAQILMDYILYKVEISQKAWM